MGFAVSAAAEFEFFLFEETPHSVREKNYRDLKNITPGFFGYSVLRSGVHADFYHELLDLANKMDFEIEGLHTETGPGVLEAAIRVDDALKAADKAALFKTYTKILAQRRGWMATFMAKWSRDWPGQSGHLHASLRDINTGKGAFYDRECQAQHVGDHALVRRRAAEADAGAPRHGRLHGEQLYAADPRLLGADRFRLGRGEPHHGACASFPAPRSRSAWSTGSPPPTSTLTSRSPPPSARACGASRTGSIRASRSRAMPMRSSTRRSGPCRARSARRPSA